MTQNQAARQPERPETHRAATTGLDLAALALILAAVVALVVFGNATAAVLAAAGGVIALCYRAWRGRDTTQK